MECQTSYGTKLETYACASTASASSLYSHIANSWNEITSDFKRVVDKHNFFSRKLAYGIMYPRKIEDASFKGWRIERSGKGIAAASVQYKDFSAIMRINSMNVPHLEYLYLNKNVALSGMTQVRSWMKMYVVKTERGFGELPFPEGRIEAVFAKKIGSGKETALEVLVLD